MSCVVLKVGVLFACAGQRRVCPFDRAAWEGSLNFNFGPIIFMLILMPILI